MAFIFFFVSIIKCLYFFLSVTYSKTGKNRNWLNYYRLCKYCEPWSKIVLLEPQRRKHNPVSLTLEGECSKSHVKWIIFFILWGKKNILYFSCFTFLVQYPPSLLITFLFSFQYIHYIKVIYDIYSIYIHHNFKTLIFFTILPFNKIYFLHEDNLSGVRWD